MEVIIIVVIMDQKRKLINFVSCLKRRGGKEKPASECRTIHDEILQYTLDL